jgi:hypothetical protein
MAKWIIFAGLFSIGLTALLTAVLMRLNKPPRRDDVERHGEPPLAAEPGHQGASENASHNGGANTGGGN